MPEPLTPEEIARSHRWHAIECNNLAWDLSLETGRTPEQDETLLHAAHASAFHWAFAGTELNQARARMLLGQAYASLMIGKPAMAYARASFAYLTSHQAPDWELAFAHAVLAHAAHAAGDSRTHAEHHARARELGEAIADPEDRATFFGTFDLIPPP